MQTQAAGLWGQSQPRISDILSGRLARFSIDMLLKISTILEFHSKHLPAKKRRTESALQIIEMFKALMDNRPIKAVYALVTMGSKTALGGEMATTSTEMKIGGIPIARVGDLVQYPDGRKAPLFLALAIPAFMKVSPWPLWAAISKMAMRLKPVSKTTQKLSGTWMMKPYLARWKSVLNGQ